MTRTAVETVRYSRTFPGQADQVAAARREVRRWLSGHPRADDAVLVLSEIATNAVLHSGSKGQSFTIRAEIFPAYLWIEAEDLGGDWALKPPDDRAHGLQVVEALAGTDNWGIDGSEAGRVVWARLELDGQR